MCKALETVHENFLIQKEAVNVSKVSDWLKELVSEIPELLSDIEDYSKALNEKEAKYGRKNSQPKKTTKRKTQKTNKIPSADSRKAVASFWQKIYAQY